MCNSIRQNWLVEELRWELRPPGPGGWDGLAWAFPELARLVSGLPQAYCRRWLAAHNIYLLEQATSFSTASASSAHLGYTKLEEVRH